MAGTLNNNIFVKIRYNSKSPAIQSQDQDLLSLQAFAKDGGNSHKSKFVPKSIATYLSIKQK